MTAARAAATAIPPTKVYVVTHQPYIYADTCELWDGEIKYALTENWEIKGVFARKDKAKAFVRKKAEQWATEIQDTGAERQATIKHQTEYHYFVDEFELK